jgi:hypothetical protein
MTGGGSYSLSFSDPSDNSAVMLRGVKKLTIMELPVMVNAPMPSGMLPDVKTDPTKDGSPYQEGATYTWADRGQATISNGVWQAVKRRNPVCGAR